MFLQFTPAYGFAFLQSGILLRAVFHKPPGRKTRCGKRTQTAVFHTVFTPQARRGSYPPSGDDAEVTPSGANAPAPPRGRLMAMPETLPPPPKAVPLRDDFPRSGGRCRVATKGGVWLDAKRQDGRGTSPIFSLPCNDTPRSTVCSTGKVSEFCPAAEGRKADRMPVLGRQSCAFCRF